MKSDRSRRTLRLDHAISKKLEVASKEQKRSINHIIVNIVRRYLIEYENDLNKINGVDN